MVLPSVPGTKTRGRIYHLNVRVPADVQDQYGGAQFVRRSLGTSDPRQAAQAVTIQRAEFITKQRAAKAKADLPKLVEQLPPDQRRLYDQAGSLEDLLAEFEATKTALALLKASDPSSTDEEDLRHPLEVELEAAEHRTASAHVAGLRQAKGKTLKALGQPVELERYAFGIRELARDYAAKRGFDDQTREAYEYVARRFIELHGDAPLEELQASHIRDYSEAVRELPAVTSSPVLRGMGFRDAVAVAKAEELPKIGERTRARHISMLKALSRFAVSEGRLDRNPWEAYKIPKTKTLHSKRASKRKPFSASHIARILETARSFELSTLDRWAPLLATYQGARREEIGQLRGCDVLEEGGIWCVRITDEGEHQKIKNESSLRTIPLHPKAIGEGFVEFAQTRPETGPLFMEPSRWGKPPHELKPDARGRFTERYGKRFSRMLREQLGITDPTLMFHSFCHAWEDAADAANMQQSHRRVLAGRSASGDSQAAYGAGPTLPALLESLSKIDPAAG